MQIHTDSCMYAASVALCVIAWNIFCLAAISVLYFLCLRLSYFSLLYFVWFSFSCEISFITFLSLPCMKLLAFLLLTLPYVRLLTFYFWHHVMLLILKENTATGNFYLWCLFYAFSMFIKNGALCTSVPYIQLLYLQMEWWYICVHV